MTKEDYIKKVRSRGVQQELIDPSSRKGKRHARELAHLQSLPTLSVGQTDDLKIETKEFRLWVSRLTKEDGMPCDNMITQEWYDSERGIWLENYNIGLA